MSKGLKALLFDLDGTLLQMDFKEYADKLGEISGETFSNILGWDRTFTARCFAYASKYLDNKPDDGRTLEEAFYDGFEEAAEINRGEFMQAFFEYNTGTYNNAKVVTKGQYEGAERMLRDAKSKGYTIILATSPKSAAEGTYFRLQWAGIPCDCFDFIATRLNTSIVKPHKAYYDEILKRFDLQPQECCVLGNDVINDLVEPGKMGMKLFWQIDWAMNKGAKLPPCEMGGFTEMKEWVDNLPDISK